MRYEQVLPESIFRCAVRMYRKYRGYLDSFDDYWQTVCLVWLRCKRRASEEGLISNYFTRSLKHELWNIGKKRLKNPQNLEEELTEAFGQFVSRDNYPDSLKELTVDIDSVNLSLEELIQ